MCEYNTSPDKDNESPCINNIIISNLDMLLLLAEVEEDLLEGRHGHAVVGDAARLPLRPAHALLNL